MYSNFIGSQYFTNNSGVIIGHKSTFLSETEVSISTSSEFKSKCFTSVDSMFAGFSSQSGFGVPSLSSGQGFPSPTFLRKIDGSVPTVGITKKKSIEANSLNINSIINSETSSNCVRSIGLKLPMFGVGYGYDGSGTAMSGSPSSWVAAPIDFRYERSRGVWTAGHFNEDTFKVGYLTTGISGVGNFTMEPIPLKEDGSLGPTPNLTFNSGIRCINLDGANYVSLAMTASSSITERVFCVVMRYGSSYIPVYIGC